MKLLLTIAFLLSGLSVFSQRDITGKYYHNLAHTLLLKGDSTYLFTTGFESSYSWSRGNWSVKRDTIYLYYIPVFDTLSLGQGRDTLVLSSDTESNRLDSGMYRAALLFGNPQNRTAHPDKLLVKKKALLIINKDGKVVTKDLYDPMTNKYFSTSFYKSKD